MSFKWLSGFEMEPKGTASPLFTFTIIHEWKIAGLLFTCIIVNTIKWKVKTRLHIFYVKGEYYQAIIISLSFLVQQCRYHDLLDLQKVSCCITHQMSDRRSDVTARIDMLT